MRHSNDLNSEQQQETLSEPGSENFQNSQISLVRTLILEIVKTRFLQLLAMVVDAGICVTMLITNKVSLLDSLVFFMFLTTQIFVISLKK